ncbi:hypothetical protein VPH35_033505 [Triticum aestivum]|uniref:(+)-delta-cadinene synthase isozyme XC1 n=1 Tax=Aegilops tauschii TaxID=37682 RepID=M8BXN2_AEGTA|nr:tau-cadinol synthase-like [Triticum aestivum]
MTAGIGSARRVKGGEEKGRPAASSDDHRAVAVLEHGCRREGRIRLSAHETKDLPSFAGTPLLVIGSLVGMGDEATDESFEWAIGYPDVVKACGEVTRFMDDLAAFKHYKNKLDVSSSLESYVNQHRVTSEMAIAVLDNLVEDAWKTTNQARFGRRALLPFVNRVTNLTKSMTLLFRDKNDLYTFSRGNKDRTRQHFIDPIPH